MCVSSPTGPPGKLRECLQDFQDPKAPVNWCVHSRDQCFVGIWHMSLSHAFLEATINRGAARLRFKEDVYFPWATNPHWNGCKRKVLNSNGEERVGNHTKLRTLSHLCHDFICLPPRIPLRYFEAVLQQKLGCFSEAFWNFRLVNRWHCFHMKSKRISCTQTLKAWENT